MQFRRLGKDGPEISVVGLGAWAIGGSSWGPQDDQESIAALHHALDSGINWVDTAPVYGLGHSEEIVGQVLRETTAEALVFTKCGLNWYGRDDREPQNDLRPESIRHELEQSLKRLGTDHVDLYQFHRPDSATGTAVEDSWATMVELVDEGRARWIGVSNFDLGLLRRCERVRHVDSVQPPISLIRREARAELLPWCEARGTGAIAYSPMQAGLLSGAFDRERLDSLAESDWRRSNRNFQEPAFSANLALAERLEPVAERHGVTVGAVAIAWVTAQPGVTGAIVGARRPSQVDGWLPAGDLVLDREDLDDIERALRETGAGRG